MCAKLEARGDELSLWAAKMIATLQDRCFELSQENRRLIEDADNVMVVEFVAETEH